MTRNDEEEDEEINTILDGRTQLGRGRLTNHKHVLNRCHFQDILCFLSQL